MKIYFFILIVLIIISCKSKPVKEIYSPKFSSTQLANQLEYIYNLKKTDNCISFLKVWNKTVVPSTEEYINQNDTLKNLYQAFSEIYPKYIKKINNIDFTD